MKQIFRLFMVISFVFNTASAVAQTVNIPDANLRAEVEAALGKGAGATITAEDMATLTELWVSEPSVLTGLEHATNLTYLGLGGNSISNISALSGLANLTYLEIYSDSISNISALSGLANLTYLEIYSDSISNISALSGLANLTYLEIYSDSISNISALSGLTNLTYLGLGGNSISNISALSGLTNLTELHLSGNSISNISALSGLTNLTFLEFYSDSISNISALLRLTNLTYLEIYSDSISNISALSGLTNLTELHLSGNSISNISALSGLTNLTYLGLGGNSISNISALSGLTNLTSLNLSGNSISNISALSGLTNLTGLYLSGNSISNISALSGLTNLTYLEIYSDSISNISALSGLTNLTGLYLSGNSISDISPLVSNTGLGTGDQVYVQGNPLNAVSINTHVPTLQSRGVDVIFDSQITSTNITVSVSPASVESPAVGEQLTLSLKIANGERISGYQATVEFDTSALRYLGGSLGGYLPAGAFFVPPSVSGNQVLLASAATTGESNGAGTLATLTFEVIAVQASTLRLAEVLLSDSAGIGYRPQVEDGQIIEPHVKGDVNRDGVVNIQDLVLTAQRLGQQGQNNADINGDGVVNIQDLVLVADAFGNTGAAPAFHPQALAVFTAADVQGWLTEADQMALTTPAHRRGIAVLEGLLAALTPKETALLPNYPNPFNPETWIPYHLANAGSVSITIYDVRGAVVRRLELGHQQAGYYTRRSRAAYWDGMNAFGERVASGLYFYTLTASDSSSIRKMLIGN